MFAINDFALPDYVSSVGPKFNVYADEVFATWQIDQADGKAVATALPLVLLTLLALLPALALRRRGAMESISGDWQRPGRHRLGAWRWPAGLRVLVAGHGRRVWFPWDSSCGKPAGAGQGWSSETLRSAFGRAIELAGDDVLATLQFAAGAASLAVVAALILGHGAARARGRARARGPVDPADRGARHPVRNRHLGTVESSGDDGLLRQPLARRVDVRRTLLYPSRS